MLAAPGSDLLSLTQRADGTWGTCSHIPQASTAASFLPPKGHIHCHSSDSTGWHLSFKGKKNYAWFQMRSPAPTNITHSPIKESSRPPHTLCTQEVSPGMGERGKHQPPHPSPPAVLSLELSATFVPISVTVAKKRHCWSP